MEQQTLGFLSPRPSSQHRHASLHGCVSRLIGRWIGGQFDLTAKTLRRLIRIVGVIGRGIRI